MPQLDQAQLLTIAQKVKAQTDKDPERHVDGLILESLLAWNPTISEQEVDNYTTQILAFLADYRETNRWPKIKSRRIKRN